MFDDLQSKEKDSEKSINPEPLISKTYSSNQNQETLINTNSKQADKKDLLEKNDKNFDDRINQLEEVGRKRGKKNKIYSVVGIIAILIISLMGIYGVYYCLTDVVDITSKNSNNEVIENNHINSEKNINKEEDIIKKDVVRESVVQINPEWTKCESDDECIVTQSDCCSCNQGGQQISINIDYLDEWNNEISNYCKEIACTEFMNCKIGNTVCEYGECRFKENNECVVEGALVSSEDKNVECCEDLKNIEVFHEEDGVCLLQEGFVVCADCPNGICGLGENECNCPDDCKGEDVVFSNENYSKDIKTNSDEMECDCIDEECANNMKKEKTDTDEDGLYDFREIFCGTDANNPDTDGDGYIDGDEVKNGYNPNGDGKL